LEFLQGGGVKTMLDIKRDYVVTDDNKKKAVLIDIETFEKIEEILESYGLGKYMEEIEDEEVLSIDNARMHYTTLKTQNDNLPL
jgi:PHD/YefM family antitoxin component YafN of YafNO toxin-antitoxin module